MVELAADKHVRYIVSVEKKKDCFESVVMDHLRMNGAYWGLTTVDLLGKLHVVGQEEVISWVMQCQHETGGFGGNIGHDPHIHYTLSAVQVLALFDKLHILEVQQSTSRSANPRLPNKHKAKNNQKTNESQQYRASKDTLSALLS